MERKLCLCCNESKFTAFLTFIASVHQSFECSLSLTLLSITGLGISSLQCLCKDPADLLSFPKAHESPLPFSQIHCLVNPCPGHTLPGGLHCLQPQEEAAGTAGHSGLAQHCAVSLLISVYAETSNTLKTVVPARRKKVLIFDTHEAVHASSKQNNINKIFSIRLTREEEEKKEKTDKYLF